MDEIESKQNQLNELRKKQQSLPINQESQHAEIFRNIWRLTTEIKALTSQVGSRSYVVHEPAIPNMGDDFTILPMEKTTLPPDPSIRVNGILFMLENLSRMPSSSDRDNRIASLQKELALLYK
jgi:hypothetical protein